MGAAAVLVTGANGFVGRAVVGRLQREGTPIHAAQRAATSAGTSAGLTVFGGQDLSEGHDWSAALAGVHAVIHCAARVHVMREGSSDPLADFLRVNVAGTLALARQAARAGVRRFVFVSSIGVNGAETHARPFRASDAPAPHSPYAVSKLEAEQALAEFGRASGLEVVIVRPPLVHGPQAPGNFGALVRAVRRGLPLPLGAVHNRRSLVGLDNLADLLVLCTRHPNAAGHTFLASDGEDLSTSQLLRRIGAALGRPARLLPVPAALLRGTLALLGKAGMGQSLCGSLQVDIGPTRERLGWQPPLDLDQALARSAAA